MTVYRLTARPLTRPTDPLERNRDVPDGRREAAGLAASDHDPQGFSGKGATNRRQKKVTRRVVERVTICYDFRHQGIADGPPAGQRLGG